MVKKLMIAGLFMAAMLHVQAGDDDRYPQIKGWKMVEEKRVYTSGDLWELINGAADIFLSYYFQDLHIAEYTNKDQIIRVELYRHSTPENAYGIFTAERMPDYPPVDIGSLGYKSQGIVNFLAGTYYVKIMSAGVKEVDENTLAMLAEEVDTKLGQPAGLPDEIKLFPEEGKVFLSDTYIAQNFLGYSFFRAAFTARYGDQGEVQLFVIQLTPDEIQKMLELYFAMLKEDKVVEKDGIYVISDPFNGTVFLKQKGSTLVGVLNTGSQEVAMGYLGKVAERIQ